MKRTSCFLLLSILLASCATAPAFTETKAPTKPLVFSNTPEAPTATEIPTATPTETPDPMAGAPEGATGKNAKGEWIKAVAENGHTYEYVYNAELGQGVREVANFPLWDFGMFNNIPLTYIPFKISLVENVPGERSLLQITHDIIDANANINPLTSTFKPQLEQRYFGIEGDLNTASNEQSRSLQTEMRKGLDSQAFLPIILSNGEPAQVRLSTDTGIILTIMDKETLFDLGGDLISTWHVGGITVYSEAYGVDQFGNMLCRFAVEGSIADLTDEDLRKALFSFPGNFVDHEDQREQGLNSTSKGFAFYSNELREDGIQDIVIDRIPVTQP